MSRIGGSEERYELALVNVTGESGQQHDVDTAGRESMDRAPGGLQEAI